jgi:N-acetylmuramic acid 6-phosphate etherase
MNEQNIQKKQLPLTETRNPRTMHLDRLPTRQLVKTIIQEDMVIASAVEACSENISQVIDRCVSSLKAGGRIVYMGAGTSGRLGVLDASECPPTFGVSPETVIALIAGGEKAVIHAAEGAEDDREAGILDLKNHNLSPNDFLIGITASGTTPYVAAGLEYARSIGAGTSLLTCNPYGKLPEVDILINPVVGPEVISGSTRMKSGTACKMVLNIISSGAMIRIGKVYENLMVDVMATNEKLRKRALRIVMEGARVPNYKAEAALDEAKGNTKLAILMASKELSLDEAQKQLELSNGFLYKALGELDYS